ncbi:unnamed protein product [Protopolystoma xenopodis]|uniref:Uncharacterized protein n=1 Tax=Protopolystoma xenopodis TaxID=117903 RepID=A0A448XG99_9PLAT|nr:unnamed protein product [Protopolystoma xenopodis]
MFFLSPQIQLGWLYQFMGVLIGSAVAPICYVATWSRLTGPATVAGAWIGMIGGLTAWLIYSGTSQQIVNSVQLPVGLSDFFAKTGTARPSS